MLEFPEKTLNEVIRVDILVDAAGGITNNSSGQIRRAGQGIAPIWFGAPLFCSRFFEIDGIEEICGQLGPFSMDELDACRLNRLRPMI